MDVFRASSLVLLAALLLWACGAQTAPKSRGAPAATCGSDHLREGILQRANAARLAGASCGKVHLAPAPPLAWNDVLATAASRHSGDMARRDYFDHATPEGQRVGPRVTAAGYAWRAVGENIAGGDQSVDAVMRGWMASASHCANIMNPEFSEIGAACIERKGTTWGTYWTMVLARKR